MLRTSTRKCVLAGTVLLTMVGMLAFAAVPAGAAVAGPFPNDYAVTKLVSDIPGEAMNLDRHLVNAWGLAAGPTSPWWVANNGTSTSTLYGGDGTVLPLVVRVGGAPTGTVFNASQSFVVRDGAVSEPSIFLFDGEAGLIRGWNPGVPPGGTSTHAFVVVNRRHVDAEYKGLAIANTSGGDFLYATDFHNRRVDVFDGNFNLVHSAGAFTDPGIPKTYAPFGIQNAGSGTILVSYAKVGPTGDDLGGPGHGFVDAYDTSGMLLARVATRGALDSPWGLAMAPANPAFGRFSGDVLVGNFGNGKINAYRWDGTQYMRDGKLRMSNGRAIKIDGLWALEFGNGGAAGSKSSLYFTAGLDDESHGLFGMINASN